MRYTATAEKNETAKCFTNTKKNELLHRLGLTPHWITFVSVRYDNSRMGRTTSQRDFTAQSVCRVSV